MGMGVILQMQLRGVPLLEQSMHETAFGCKVGTLTRSAIVVFIC